MTPPDNEQTESKSSDKEYERTATLFRCEKHDLVYMENETCPECEKEKGADGKGAG